MKHFTVCISDAKNIHQEYKLYAGSHDDAKAKACLRHSMNPVSTDNFKVIYCIQSTIQ